MIVMLIVATLKSHRPKSLSVLLNSITQMFEICFTGIKNMSDIFGPFLWLIILHLFSTWIKMAIHRRILFTWCPLYWMDISSYVVCIHANILVSVGTPDSMVFGAIWNNLMMWDTHIVWVSWETRYPVQQLHGHDCGRDNALAATSLHPHKGHRTQVTDSAQKVIT